jgi:hypothetical protein
VKSALDILASLNPSSTGILTGIATGVALTFLFTFLRAMLKNARVAAAKTPNKVDDAAVEALETAVDAAQNRLPR